MNAILDAGKTVHAYLLSCRYLEVLLAVTRAVFLETGSACYGIKKQGDSFVMQRFDSMPERFPGVRLSIEYDAIVSAVKEGSALKRDQVKIMNGKSVRHGTEPLVLRCFCSSPPYPMQDIESIIYPAMFAASGHLLWSSTSVSAIAYPNNGGGPTTLVSLGLNRHPTPYELMMPVGTGERILQKEFVGWVEHFSTGSKPRIGEWLDYNTSKLPGTNLAGFIVTKPRLIPERIPFKDTDFEFCQLLGVTAAELQFAKLFGGQEVLSLLESNGIGDVTHSRRKSCI